MSVPVGELSDIEKDALAEIANMGVSRAAAAFARWLASRFSLSVPAVNIVTREAAAGLVERGNSPRLVAVQQSFEGPFSGRALLIFPEAQSSGTRPLHCGRGALTRRRHRPGAGSAGGNRQHYPECVPGYDRQCARRSMRMSLPSVIRGDGATLFETRSSDPDGDLVLFLYIDFTIKSRDVRGFIALLMDLPSITALKEIVGDFIEGIEK